MSSSCPAGGGPIEGICQVSRTLLELGHTTEMVCLDDPRASWLAGLPFVVHALGTGYGGYRFHPALVSWLRRNAPRYDAVVVSGLWQYHGYATWRALRRGPTPYFVFPHGMLDPWFKHAYPLKHLKKWLYWPWADYRLLRDARAVLFTSEEERRVARESFWLYRCRERVVHYGTAGPAGSPADQREAFLSRFPDLRRRRRWLFLGRIHPKKGCDLVIRSLARCLEAGAGDVRLVMAGPDSVGWRAELERLARSLGVADHVTWTGMLSGDLKWGALRAAEVFLLPSHQENFGIAVAEALACGVPVLISRQVNTWREIEQEQAGLVGSDNMEGVAQLLAQWLQLTEAKRQNMRTAARSCFERHFEIGNAARSLAESVAAGPL